ncbi:uncharacterized protein LOC128554246 [Mercenaria mercenaria]|uniref:uncharacterized protein LOC128554246 n=1 Tax=Mercenaria mercenaria TaxID=6596 RepID=UPI00234F3ABC|nr:uncharacterized protein LOC128554246 [Mercenaria mercenaria]
MAEQGKGLKFCSKTKSHDKVKLAEDIFKFTRRIRLKEYFHSQANTEFDDSELNDIDSYGDFPFFNKKGSSFTPPAGHDVYLDFYINAVTEEILQSEHNRKRYSNITKAELDTLRKLSQDKTIVIKKADKSNTIVIMNTEDYKNEVLRQLNNDKYYEKCTNDPTDEIKRNISQCVANIETTDEFDTFPANIRTPCFYILPKIHKQPDNNLPMQYPGRPIVSAFSSPTENISKYIDYILKPYMIGLPSYVKDTADFINKVKDIKLETKSYLVTLDVTSLYTNIPHDDGINACKSFLQQNIHGRNLSTDEIACLIRLVLENNYFKFCEQFYLQKMGTAMGSSMAPSYASLFMGKLEKDFLHSRGVKPSLWLRFLDDIFMIWNHSLEELESFIDDLNKFHPNIKFTTTISESTVSFLDVQVSKNKSLGTDTDIYVKETNTHQYLDYTSCHPKQCKDGIPYSQAKRYRRIISNDEKFNSSLNDLRSYFKDRNFPDFVIDSAFNKVSRSSQNEALTPSDKNKTSVIPFTVEYNPSLPNISEPFTSIGIF